MRVRLKKNSVKNQVRAYGEFTDPDESAGIRNMEEMF
jgi:hypothetical protein